MAPDAADNPFLAALVSLRGPRPQGPVSPDPSDGAPTGRRPAQHAHTADDTCVQAVPDASELVGKLFAAPAATAATPGPKGPAAKGSGAQPVSHHVEELDGILKSVGVASAPTRSTADERARQLLADKGLEVKVESLRWGRLVLSGDPVTARLVRYEKDRLVDELAVQLGEGVVTEIVVRVRR